MQTHNMQHQIKSPDRFILILYIFAIFGGCSGSSDGNKNGTEEQKSTLVKVGVVGDMNSSFSRMMSLCMDMAIFDFYSANPHYKTKLQLNKTNAKSMLDFNLAVLESAKHVQVVSILGPRGSSEEEFAAAVGESDGTPIISFTARSSAQSKNSYLVRTTLDDAVQAQALAAICQKFEWSKVVIVYEDAENDNRFFSHIIKAFQDVHIGLARMVSIATSAEDRDVLKELNELKREETKVIIVHMHPALGYRLFQLADTAGMMSEGYAWIITDSLSIFQNFTVDGSTDGVLGVRPYPFPSKKLRSFQERWKRNMLVNKIVMPIMELNNYGLWAYDAITALALAVEQIRPVNSSSSYGVRLLSKLSSTKFRGLTGDFQLVEGKLKPSAYEIFNIIGTGETRVGFWKPERGVVSDFKATSTKELRKIMWPGDSVIRPKGWRIPATGNLRIGIPSKNGFKEFISAKCDPINNRTNATGFAVDIFLTALKVLPFPVNYTYHCYNISKGSNGSYDGMLRKIPEDYDMVVADTTIWAPRAEYVDFSLPYSESGVVLVVRNKKPVDMWIFLKPLRWDLWLAIIISCIFMGFALHILERGATNADEGTVSPRADRPRFVYWSPLTILAFPERNMVSNNWSVFTLVCWLFMAFILMQSFTASLSAILTVDQLKFSFSEDYYVGYHEGSFLKTFLVEQLNIREARLRPYPSVEDFHDAMLKGSKNGGIDALFDEIPYMKLFLNRYQSQYKMVGPTYRTDGLGFAFQKASPLIAYFSRAILNVTQGPEMNNLEQKNFGPGYSSQDPLSSVISQGMSNLTLRQFAGLFLTVGSLTLLALFCSETAIGRKITNVAGSFVQNGFSGKTAQVHSMKDTSVDHSGETSSLEFAREDDVNSASQRDGDEVIDGTDTNDEVVIASDDEMRVVIALDDEMRFETHR